MTDFGLLIFATDYSVRPDVLAREAEAHGFESLFFPDTHIFPPAAARPGRVVLTYRNTTGTVMIPLSGLLWPPVSPPILKLVPASPW